MRWKIDNILYRVGKEGKCRAKRIQLLTSVFSGKQGTGSDNRN
jgi:hypothetical protein